MIRFEPPALPLDTVAAPAFRRARPSNPLAAGALKRYADRVRAQVGVWVAALSALLGGCVSASGENVLDRDCHVTWLDDGVMMTATTGNATWASNGGRESVDVLGFK